jgi:hypothetical protein
MSLITIDSLKTITRARTKSELLELDIQTLQNIIELFNLPNDKKLNEKIEIIEFLDSKYSTGTIEVKPELANPYRCLSLMEVRGLPISDNYNEQIKILIEDDYKTDHLFKRKILSKNLFDITDPIELILYGAVYGHSIINFDMISAKQLIYIFMILPVWNNYLRPLLIVPAYFNRISVEVKRYALRSFFVVGVDVNFLSDTEVNQAFNNGFIEPKYNVYAEREERYNKLMQLPEWFRNRYFKNFFKIENNNDELYKIVTTTEPTNFEKTLYECKNVDQIAKKIGIFFPVLENGEEVSHLEYFFNNYSEYTNIGTEFTDLFKSIEKGTLKKYLNNLTDFQIFSTIGFVHFNSRIELITKIENLIKRTTTFFVKLEDNNLAPEGKENEKRMIFFAFGTYSKYVLYSNEQLYGSFSRSRKFKKPGSKEDFTTWQIGELILLLNYYRDVCMDLLVLIYTMLGKIIK